MPQPWGRRLRAAVSSVCATNAPPVPRFHPPAVLAPPGQAGTLYGAMEIRCPKCKRRQNVVDAEHNARVTCSQCGRAFKAIGLVTTEIADDLYAKVMAQLAEKDEPE